jgi:hypothetical protein
MTGKTAHAIDIVKQWLEAANSDDASRLVALSAPDIRIVGPRGTARGAEVLRDWLARARAHLTTQSVYARESRVVVAQHGIWHDASGAVAGEADVASRFVTEKGRVVEYERHEALAGALASANLTRDDRA